MMDSVPQRIETLSAQLSGLETAAASLPDDPSVGVSVRRIARSLEGAARALGLEEVAAGAQAIQRAADAHLARSVENFLLRIVELRDERPADDATILIVEDNKTIATATTAYLRSEGRRITVVETAERAMDVLASEDVDLVVLDLILPDRDGRDVLVQMREDVNTSIIPVVVLSSNAGAVARAECLAVGADDFLEKPADPKVLRATAARLVKAGRQRRDAVRDGLTGLPNRAGLLALYEGYRRKAEPGALITVAMLSLDPVAEVTMRLGLAAGDRFLLEVCAAVHEALGKGDRLGRWETSELVAILPDRTAEEAKRILETTIRMLTADDALDDIRQAGIDITLSGGVATVANEEPLHEAISSAQRFLYAAKASGGDTVHADDDAVDLGTHRILLVEDDRVTATLLHHRLVRDGHDVVAFADGREAHDWARDEDFDLAVLDVKVPGMDGFELLAKLRDIPRYRTVPIVMLTGMGSEADVVRGLELGADDYMLKPFSPTELLARVRRLLHAHAGSSQADTGERPMPPTGGSTPPPPGSDPTEAQA